MEYLLFVIYLVLFAWLVTKVRFYNSLGLTKPQLVIIFLLKIIAGIFYGWIGIYYGGLAQMWDTWGYHANGLAEYKLLFNNPHEYFTNLFYDPYNSGFTKFLGTTDSYWNDLKGNAFIKILSIFDLLSFGNYYVNVIFYSFITMLGPLCTFKVFSDVFPKRKLAILIATICIPSFLYWTSGIHKEGLIFTGLGLIMYSIYFGAKEKKFGIKRILALLVGLLMILVLRNFIIIILIPAIFAWIISIKWSAKSLWVYASVYSFFILMFFLLGNISTRLNFPQAVVTKQKEFLKLGDGNSTVPITELEPTVTSFLKNTPQAFNLTLLRPYPSDVKHILSLAASIEVIVVLLFFVLFLFFYKNGIQSKPFLYFCLFFSFTLLLAIGFSVNNLGAISRYRSIALPLLIAPMVALTDWKRIGGLLSVNIKNKINM